MRGRVTSVGEALDESLFILTLVNTSVQQFCLRTLYFRPIKKNHLIYVLVEN